MKKILRSIAKSIGLLPHLQVFKEKYFPSEYLKNSRKNDIKYINFYSQFIKSGDLCFDIGAHRGHRTNIFLKIGAKVLAIEPQKDLYKYLKLKFAKNISLENIGLGSKEQKMTMYISELSSLSTFSTEWIKKATNKFADVRWNKKQEIQISTLDKLITKYGTPTFCKIDVEGFEYEVLKGLSQNVKYISIEFMTPENNEIIKNCLLHLYKLNPRITINYSQGDTMLFALKEWLNYDEAIKLFNNDLFNQDAWGDIYIKMPI